MSIMNKLRMRDPDAGYATDFVAIMKYILPQCQAKGIKIIANAGGVNPRGCANAVKAVAEELGLKGLKIGIVEGDDILGDVAKLMEDGEEFKNLDTGAPVSEVTDKLASANVYIGAKPIADCLDQGADIVITGRATDPSLVVGPMIHEFGWSMEDYDRLASATVMGHILECGAQCTGGNYNRWRDVPNFGKIGYPVAEACEDGSFTITKHEATGGLINEETVASQLLYEMADPKRYLGPDCTADFTTINLEQDGDNRVRISGVKGTAPTDTYKVSMAYKDGYKITGMLTVTGPDAVEKAKLCAEIVFERCAMQGMVTSEEDRFVELLGTNICYDGIVPPPEQPAEILLRVGAKGQDRKKLDTLGRELAPLVTAGPPGITGFAAGRPKASPIIGYWPALIDKTKIETTVTVEEV